MLWSWSVEVEGVMSDGLLPATINTFDQNSECMEE